MEEGASAAAGHEADRAVPPAFASQIAAMAVTQADEFVNKDNAAKLKNFDLEG